MKKVSGPLKLLYSQYRELQSFAQFGSDLDADTKTRLEQGARIVEVLKQDRNAPLPVELQIIIIYAVTNNLLAEVPVAEIRRFEKELFDHINTLQPELVEMIGTKKVMDDEMEAAIRNTVKAFVNVFLCKPADSEG